MLCLLLTVLILVNSAYALTIRVAPQTLVLSSAGGKLTVHTDVPYTEAETVLLKVNDSLIEIDTFADNLGNLVAQCDKADVEASIGEFDGKWTTAVVSLEVDGDSASEIITVKK